MRPLLFAALLTLAACGPQIGDLERGEEARVVRTYSGDTLELDNGLRVFLAEIDAPRGEEDYAAQAQGELEAQAREAERGMWARRAYRPLNVRAATEQALTANESCLRGIAPYRVLEGRVAEARVFQNRAALTMEGSTEDAPFTLVVFGENFSAWDGPALSSLTGTRVRARGPLGVYRDAPQLCLEHGSQLEVLTEDQPT